VTAVSPKLAVLCAICLLQLIVPASMIGKREAALRAGTAYKFKTAPVDPHDPFRGRYVALNFDERTGQLADGHIEQGKKIYVKVYEGDDGFAKLGRVSVAHPEEGDYIKVRAQYAATGPADISVELPFNRYYMNEKKAPEAERAYFANSRGTNRNTFAIVKVLDGMAVTEGLYIDGIHVRDYLDAKDGK